MSDIIFKVSYESRDYSEDSELVIEDKVESHVQEILSRTRNVNKFKLTVERVQ